MCVAVHLGYSIYLDLFCDYKTRLMVACFPNITQYYIYYIIHLLHNT